MSDHNHPVAVRAPDTAAPGQAPDAALVADLVAANHIHVVLMRGHGSTVVANSIPLAVYRGVYAELNAKYQRQASAMGEVIYLTEAEGQACTNRVEGQVQRPWDLWKAQAAQRRP